MKPRRLNSQGKLLGDNFRNIHGSKSRVVRKRAEPVVSSRTSSVTDDEQQVLRSSDVRGSSGGSSEQSPQVNTTTTSTSSGDVVTPKTSHPSRQESFLVPGSDQSAMSELSASIKPRPIPPRGSPSRKRSTEKNFDGDSKRTESTFLETLFEDMCNFCSGGLDLDQTPTNSKDERKQEAEETFLGKIITCQPVDMDQFGCANYEQFGFGNYTNYGVAM